MATSPQTEIDLPLPGTETAHWALATRISFRFAVFYFGLYCLLTQIFTALVPIPGLEIPDLGELRPFRDVVIWTAKHVFGYRPDLVYQGSGSGDKVFDWVQVFCFLIAALAVTCVWSVLDQKRKHYVGLHKWFRVFVRFALAGQMFTYGMVKVVPLQMPYPPLYVLLKPFGSLSPMGVLWSSVGAAPAYERFVGCAELLAGVLLVVPATSMLGALICLADMTEVFALNMTYDVPVKLFSFHMILMAAFLLLPDRTRLIQFCFRNCAIDQAIARGLFTGIRANRIALGAQLAFGLALLGSGVFGIWQYSKTPYFADKSPFYGIWNVDEMSIDGVVRSPLVTDYGRLRRVILDRSQSIQFERMDDSVIYCGVAYDAKTGVLKVNEQGDPQWKGHLKVSRQGLDRMTLDGQLGKRATRMQLSLINRNHFLLLTRGFHWVQDYPFNR